MQKRSSKQGSGDINDIAFRVSGEAVGDAEPTQARKKNPAAVELGRAGGLVGGKMRAAKLSAEQRTEIARNAARKRWEGHHRD